MDSPYPFWHRPSRRRFLDPGADSPMGSGAGVSKGKRSLRSKSLRCCSHRFNHQSALSLQSVCYLERGRLGASNSVRRHVDYEYDFRRYVGCPYSSTAVLNVSPAFYLTFICYAQEFGDPALLINHHLRFDFDPIAFEGSLFFVQSASGIAVEFGEASGL